MGMGECESEKLAEMTLPGAFHFQGSGCQGLPVLIQYVQSSPHKLVVSHLQLNRNVRVLEFNL